MRILLICILAIMLALPINTLAQPIEEPMVAGDFYYVLTDEGTAAIVDYTGETERLTIPDELDGFPVTAITAFAFNAHDNLGKVPGGVCSNLKELSLPASIVDIGDWAFSLCTSLEVINLPDEVSSFGIGVFYGCEKLAEVTVPQGATILGSESFTGCTNLLRVILPEGISGIGDKAFAFCRKLEHVSIPEGMRSIGNSAFSFCAALQELYLPASITEIGPLCFSFCDNLNLLVKEGSWGHLYAQREGIPFIIE